MITFWSKRSKHIHLPRTLLPYKLRLIDWLLFVMLIRGFKVTVQACSDDKFHFISLDLFFLPSLFFCFPLLLWELTRLYLIGKCFAKTHWIVNVFERGTSGEWNKIFVGMFWLNVNDILCFSLAYWINCVCLGMVWKISSLAQARRQKCRWLLKLMMSQVVQGMWLHTGYCK